MTYECPDCCYDLGKPDRKTVICSQCLTPLQWVDTHYVSTEKVWRKKDTPTRLIPGAVSRDTLGEVYEPIPDKTLKQDLQPPMVVDGVGCVRCLGCSGVVKLSDTTHGRVRFPTTMVVEYEKVIGNITYVESVRIPKVITGDFCRECFYRYKGKVTGEVTPCKDINIRSEKKDYPLTESDRQREDEKHPARIYR